MRLGVTIAISCAALLVGACTFDDDLDLSEDEQYGTNLNGTNLNGTNLNGTNLNGTNLNGSELGRYIKWVRYQGATLDGAKLKDVHLDGSELVGRRKHAVRRGAQLVGATFDGKSDENELLLLRVAGVTPPTTGDTWRYTVEYQELDGSWQPICFDGTTNRGAVPIDGWWDHKYGSPGDGGKHTNGNRFLFACEVVGALGKCIDAGYRPWATLAGTSLDEYHQACVRLIRADFCGTSMSHTVDGALVNLYDDLGIQIDTDDWVPEAEWTPDGALCISPHTRAIDEIACADELLDDDCATELASGALILSETPEAP